MSAEREIADAAAQDRPTPFRVFLAQTARARFRDVARRVADVSTERLAVRAAYSVKTNPQAPFLDAARQSGMPLRVGVRRAAGARGAFADSRRTHPRRAPAARRRSLAFRNR